MPQEERYGQRDLTYSAWHRRKSTGRYVGIEDAQRLAMIDIDVVLYVEVDRGNKMPVAYIEEAQDIGQYNKPSTITRNVAMCSDRPAFVVLWTPSAEPNPADTKWPDIAEFRIKRLWPQPEGDWRILSPVEYAKVLLKMRSWEAERLDKDLFGGIAA